MQVAPEQGALLTMLVRAAGRATAVEVGTFTGFSSLCIARAARRRRFLCCDASEEWTSIARRHWQKAGVADNIELRIAPGDRNAARAADVPHIDLAFIDADKPVLPRLLRGDPPRLRPGGLILVDNVLWAVV